MNQAVPPRDFRTDLRALVAYALIAAASFPRLLAGEQLCGGSNIFDQAPFAAVAPADYKVFSNEVGGDTWRQFRAFQSWQHQAGREGRFPFWNPYEYMGCVFHANGQSALFHPWNLIYWWVDPDVARGPMAIVRLWTAGAFTYLLLRRWGIAAVAAFAGGGAWMFSAFNVRWFLWSLPNVILWLPVVAWALDRLLDRPSVRRLAVASLAATVMQLAGHPETQFQAGVVAGLLVLVRLAAAHPPRHVLRGIGLSFAAMVLGTLGSAVQTWPFVCDLLRSADWAEHSRGAGEYLEPPALKTLLVPDCFGRPRGGRGYAGPDNYVEDGSGFGEIMLGAAVAAFTGAILGAGARFHRRLAFRFVACAAFFLGLAYGTPVLAPLVNKLPLFDQCNSRRWVLGVQFFGVLAGAIGMHLAITDRRARWMLAAWLGAVVFASGGIILQSERATPTRLAELLAEPSLRSVEQHPALHATMGWLCTLAALVATLAGWPRGIALAAFLAVAQGFFTAWDFSVTAPRTHFAPPEPPNLTLAKRLAGDGRILGTEEVLSPNLSLLYRFRDVRGYDFPISDRIARVFDRLGWDRRGMTLVPRNSLIPNASAETAAFLERCCVRVIFSNLRLEEISVGRARWQQVAEGPTPDAVYVSPAPPPRVRIAPTARFGNTEQAFAALFQPMTSTAAVLEASSSAVMLPNRATGTATIVRDEPERVEIDVDTPTGGAVVLADRMAPGWWATLDGGFTPAFTADYLFRAVVIPPGKHFVAWNYTAPGFRLGCAISSVTVALLALGLSIRGGLPKF